VQQDRETRLARGKGEDIDVKGEGREGGKREGGKREGGKVVELARW
jgi:hypothetical protein